MEYRYEGVDKSGKRVTGSLEAANEGELRMALRTQGIRPSKISKAAGKGGLEAFLKGRVNTVPISVLVVFTRQMYVLINSGIPLLQALEILFDQSIHPTFKQVLAGLKERVARGSYLWEALNAYPAIFPKLFVALIRAGEASGSLDQMLKRLSRYIEDEDRLRKMIKSTMMYPVVVVLIGVGVVAFIMVVVIPKFEELFAGSGQALPLPTQMVIAASKFMINNLTYIIGVLIAIYYLILNYLKSAEGRAFRDRLFFRAPLFGNLMQKAGVARFCRTMQTLLVSGVNLIDAIDICKSTIDNAVLEEAVGKVRGMIESGQTLGMAISRLSVFPKMAYQMIQVGESTGSLDKMLEKISDFYEADVESMVGGMSKLIEPLVIVFLGGIVGALMIAMYLPIFKLAGGGAGGP